MEHFSNDHKNHPNQHEKSHKLCHEKWRRLMSLREILRQQHDQNFYKENIRESHIKRNTSVRRKKKINPEEQDLKSHSQESE